MKFLHHLRNWVKQINKYFSKLIYIKKVMCEQKNIC